MKKNSKESCCCATKPWVKDFGLLALRLAIGSIFIYAGWMKLSDMAQVVSMFTGIGIPLAGVTAWVVSIAEFIGGIALVLGILTRIAALGLALIMVGAMFIVHISMGFDAGAQLVMVIFAGCLALAGTGGGNWKAWSCKCPCS